MLVLDLWMSNKPVFEDASIYKIFETVNIVYDTVISNVQFVDSFGRSRFYPTTTPAR